MRNSDRNGAGVVSFGSRGPVVLKICSLSLSAAIMRCQEGAQKRKCRVNAHCHKGVLNAERTMWKDPSRGPAVSLTLARV
jgi:hypothetical protein